jgi:hypothetical protein
VGRFGPLAVIGAVAALTVDVEAALYRQEEVGTSGNAQR